jgi:hypothetical protein
VSLASVVQDVAGAAAATYETLVAAGAAGASAQFASVFTRAPIYLVNGVAASMQGGTLSLSDPSLLPKGFAQFRPVSGASLLKNECAQYPMGNQAIAGNAMIALPTRISIEMICPANAATVPYGNKSAIISALIATLKQHNASGGVYTVYTPAFTWQNCVMVDFRDVTPADVRQTQAVFVLDFFEPLITIADAQAAQGSLYQALTSGAPIVGQPSFSTGAVSPNLANSPSQNLLPPTIQ